jgi:3-hydroxy acid dehydrogenase / malonic semialdehyde reductase
VGPTQSSSGRQSAGKRRSANCFRGSRIRSRGSATAETPEGGRFAAAAASIQDRAFCSAHYDPYVPALDGKTAIVTGASSGIGAATVRALGREGVRVAGGARRTDRLEGDLRLELDVTDPESCERFVEQAVEELGGLDILVNAAGLALGRDPFWDSSEQDERVVLETNVNGLIRMTRLCLPHIRDGGHIVNMGSVAGRQAYPNGSLYVTSKFAVRGFTYALREDLLGRPIRLTTVDPGLVETDFSIVRFRGDETQAKAVYEGVEAMQPDDIADCVVFALTRPPHVNVDELVVKALAQSSGGRILRS